MKRPTLLLAGVCCLSLALLAACAQDIPYDKYAIVYGVADYQVGISDLSYPDDDALAMEALLTDPTQGYQVLRRIDSAATKANLLADIASVAAAAKEEDLFVFYYSGHGGQAGTGAEGEGSDSANEWIFLYGSDDSANLSLTFSDDQLLDAFSAIPCRKKVIILDSCNSGGFIGSALEADSTPPSAYDSSDGVAALAARALKLYANFGETSADILPWEALVLSASGEQEFSYENGSPYYHGVFTYYLLQADQEGDDNGDGWVTATEAFDYARRMINRDWNLYYGFAGMAFYPHVSGGPVDYVLLKAR